MVGLTREQRLERELGRIDEASERIDRDPEEALEGLKPSVKVDPSAGELTMQDIFGLFVQLQRRQDELQERLVGALVANQQKPQRAERDTKEELEQAAKQQRMTLDAWNNEPREPVWLQPDLSEDKVFAVMGKYPPRVFRINGLEFPINVGEVVEVPSSVAAVVRYSQKQRPMQRPPQGLPQIPDPARSQFLAGGQEISPGNPGKTGEGRLIPAPVAASPASAGPLDQRYDAWGR